MKKLAGLLASMRPMLNEGVHVFATVPPGFDAGLLAPLGTFREAEGLTVIVEERQAREHGLPILFRAAWITLAVHSDLHAVGLTAAVSKALAEAGISCNVVAAARHDHVFVPRDRGYEALAALEALQQRSRRAQGSRPTTNLVPMSGSEFDQFVAEIVPAYAADKVASGQWSPAESLELARKDIVELLPAGLDTPGNHLFSIRSRSDGEPVGWIWYAEQERGGNRIAYVYDVSIRPECQRQGHASRAFLALESEAARQGLSGVALHVFGHNHAARALYAKLGFEPTNVNLYKPIGATGT